jgi:hypothetical protein
MEEVRIKDVMIYVTSQTGQVLKIELPEWLKNDIAEILEEAGELLIEQADPLGDRILFN